VHVKLAQVAHSFACRDIAMLWHAVTDRQTDSQLLLHCVRLSRFRVVDEVKQKLLAFLLRDADDLLVTSGCPIKKVC